ncbi:AAA family ATPase [Kutzneria sp. CA-103260]|uniref:AAA family ATPase n=1 Tax=Kutzneria sp. CA-103260 TaxID=2802641 RepID=UPI001BAA5027|nr:LuxR family transcriptional regulator [Kutzneria sp. CA-103260]QUQ72387.1 LuxR family transcriptional regulator [Kutzneria sp. CA-103260]
MRELGFFRPPARLVGRAAELARVRDFFAADADNDRVLLLSGEPGVGKSALADAAANVLAASGALVLRAEGSEFEAEVSFATLSQAFTPILDSVCELSDVYRDALESALGFSAETTSEPLVLGNAVLALLNLVAAERSVVLIVDDFPLIDPASATVLDFVARRLRGSCVGLLAVARSGDQNRLGGIVEFELTALDEQSSTLLIDARFPRMARVVRRRLLAEARGNPLALLELPAALTESQLAALETIPPLLPLSPRLRNAFGARIEELDAECRRLLLLAALDGTGDLAVPRALAKGDLADLAAAERGGIIAIGERLEFVHPLIRAAVVARSTSAERRQGHRVLADLPNQLPERLAWHLAEATVRADEKVAALLADTAGAMVRRGDAAGATAMLTRAAELSPRPEQRSRRLAHAAHICAEGTGALDTAANLLEEARRVDPDVGRSLRASVAAVHILLGGGSTIDTAGRLLVHAVENTDDPDDDALVDALQALNLVCWYGGRLETWDAFHRAMDRLGADAPQVLALAARTFSDPVRTGWKALADVDAIVDSAYEEQDLGRIVRIATAVRYLDRVGDLRDPLWRVVRHGRDGGPARRHLSALVHLSVDDFLTGRWDEAAELAGECADICEQSGYRFFAWQVQYSQLLLAAGRGDLDAATSLHEKMIRWATPRGVEATVVLARQAYTLALLGAGDYEAAYRTAIAVTPPGELRSHVPHALWSAFDLVEAAVRTNRHSAATAHVQALREAGVAELSPRLAMLVGGAAALAATDDDRALQLFEEALTAPGADRWRFEFARIQLAYGERLRLARATTQARAQLDAAMVVFRELGAEPWTARAAQGLRAAGQSDTGGQGRGELTVQEHEVAQLAASGLTNKQIAARLLLSPRTVSTHLYHAFPKLGVTSRAGLRDALTSLDQGE